MDNHEDVSNSFNVRPWYQQPSIIYDGFEVKRADYRCSMCTRLSGSKCYYKTKIPTIQEDSTEAQSCPSFLPVGFDEPPPRPTINDVSISKSNNGKPTAVFSAGEKFEDVLFEQVEGNQYALRWRDKSEIEIVNEVVHKGTTFKPLPYTPWKLPPRPESYDLETLYDIAKQYILARFDITDDLLLDVMTSWSIATWRFEDFLVAPMLYFHGAKQSGKTRGQELLSALSYRGLSTVGLTSAVLFREATSNKPTLHIDECENLSKNEELRALLNCRYKKGMKVGRTQKAENGNYSTQWYNCYGFTTLSSTRSLPETLESRAIIFRMSQNTRPVIKYNPEDLELNRFRGQLLKYRLDNFGKELPEIDLSNLTRNDRLIELFTPLFQVAPQSKHSSLKECLSNISTDRKEEDESGFEVQLLKAILQVQQLTQNDRLRIRDVVDKFNLELPLNEHWKIRQTRGLCRKLGFKDVRCLDSQGNKGILLDPKNLIRQCSRYGLVYPLTVNPPISLGTVGTVEGSTAVNDPKTKGKLDDFTLDLPCRPVDPIDPTGDIGGRVTPEVPHYKPLIQRNFERGHDLE